MLELNALEVRPDSPDAQPLSDFFVNKRIELLIEEAESYRNEALGRRADIFLAEQKPWGDGSISTIYLAAAALILTALAACSLTAVTLIIQSCRTR